MWCRDLYIRALLAKQNKNGNLIKNNTKQSKTDTCFALFRVVFIRFYFCFVLQIRPVCRDLCTTCAYMLIVRSSVPLRQPEDGQYRPKHVVVHYIVIKYTSCDTVVFDYIQFSKFHTHTHTHTHTTGMTHFLVW